MVASGKVRPAGVCLCSAATFFCTRLRLFCCLTPPTRFSRPATDPRCQLSSPEFYAACSASPPPPLSLVFGESALTSRMAVFERLRLLRAAAGRSAARDIRARVAEKEVRKGMASGVGGEQLLAGEKSALGKLEVCTLEFCGWVVRYIIALLALVGLGLADLVKAVNAVNQQCAVS